MANAALDSIPMVVIAGDVQSYFHGRHPHQEVNLHHDASQLEIYRPFCKRVYRVDRVGGSSADSRTRVPPVRRPADPGPVLVDVPMDIFSADLPADAFQKTPSPIARPTLDAGDRRAASSTRSRRPIGRCSTPAAACMSARATAELAALAEALEVPVAHTLMGKGCLHDDHPLLLGQTGFWGLPIANDTCRRADLIVAIGTRLAEANSSSWDPRFTFAIPPTRLIHIDADAAEIGRNYPTELGVVADAKVGARRARRSGARPEAQEPRIAARRHRARPPGVPMPTSIISGSRISFRCGPERILSDLRRALPADGFLVTDVGWNKNGVAQQFPITVPGTFITPSGLATMGFGPAAVLGVKMAFPNRAAVSLVGDGGFSANPSVVATAMEADLPVVWVVMDNNGFGTIAGLEAMHYGWSYGCMFERKGEPYRTDYAAMARSFGARGVAIESADSCIPRSSRRCSRICRP